MWVGVAVHLVAWLGVAVRLACVVRCRSVYVVWEVWCVWWALDVRYVQCSMHMYVLRGMDAYATIGVE